MHVVAAIEVGIVDKSLPAGDGARFFDIDEISDLRSPLPHTVPPVEKFMSRMRAMGVGDKLDRSKSVALSPGSIMILQPKTNHFAWNKEEVIVQLNGNGPWGITYVNPADDPRKRSD